MTPRGVAGMSIGSPEQYLPEEEEEEEEGEQDGGGTTAVALSLCIGTVHLKPWLPTNIECVEPINVLLWNHCIAYCPLVDVGG